MRLTTRLKTMDPAEKRVWTHDFVDDLASGETVSAILSVNVTVDFALPGITPHSTPNNIKDGLATISGTTKILQGLTDPVHGNDYKLKAEVRTSTNRELVAVAILPARTL